MERKIELNNMFTQSQYFQPNYYYFQKHGEMPDKIVFIEINRFLAINNLLANYNYENSFGVRYVINDLKVQKVSSYVFEFQEKILVYFNPGIDETVKVELLFCSSSSKELIRELSEAIFSCKYEFKKRKKIHLVTKSYNEGLSITPMDVKPIKNDIKINYNNDFYKEHENICERLNKKNDHGLVLLHGQPGTGKTTYIRSLTGFVDKQIIYLPPDLAYELATPSFISFLINYPNSILVIEDAETIIKQRSNGGSGVVSNLLNLTDGLLSDCLNIQIVCTFNCNVDKIDSALLRKGRLISLYEFKKLEMSKAQKLINHLGLNYQATEDMSLAEIYNLNEKSYEESKRKSVGFKQSA